MSDDKKSLVLDAALKVFAAHGYRRVTMSDIAREAGMSRPALYLVFSNKEEIFRAGIEQFVDQVLSEIRAGVDEKKTLEDKLRFVFELWTVRPFELMHQTPDVQELTDCTYGFARDVVERTSREFEEILLELFAPYRKLARRRKLDLGNLARMVALSVKGLKMNATSVEELRTLLRSLVQTTVAALEPREEASR